MHIEKLKEKEIYLYRFGKMYLDIQYVLDGLLNIVGGVNAVSNIRQEGLLDYNDYLQITGNKLLVICDLAENYKNYPEITETVQLNEDYVFVDTILEFLNTFDNYSCTFCKSEKKIFGWGTGHIATYFEENENNYPDIAGWIDSNKQGEFYGKPIYHYSEITNWDEIFIIILTDYWMEIVPLLTERGLVEDRDFIVYRKKHQFLSELFKTVLIAEPTDIGFCEFPFYWAVVYEAGNLHGCCLGLNEPFGNVFNSDINDIWHSVRARIIRLSIINRTFVFCDPKTCPYVLNKKNIEFLSEYEQRKETDVPEWLQVNYDYTCNLYCPSCRDKVRIAQKYEKERAMTISDMIADAGWMNRVKRVTVAGNGEALFSQAYRHLIFDGASKRNITLTLGTNGILLTEDIIKELLDKYDSLDICLSLDAATEATYNKIRRGGNWHKLMINLQNIKKYIENNQMSLSFSFVVQRDNYSEMPDYVKMAIHYKAYAVIFRPIQNWGTYTAEEFEKIDMFTNGGKGVKEELRNILRNPIFRTEEVRIGGVVFEKLIYGNGV